MPDLICHIPNHGYSDNTFVYVSWLNANYYIYNKGADSFKLTEESGGPTIVQFTTTVTDGYVREVAGSGATTISGLDHLEGETVVVTAGGSVVGTEVVSSGSITLSSTVFTYQVGLPYKMKVRTMRLSVPQAETVQTRIKRIHETVVRYIKSKGGKAGQEYDGTEYLSDLDATFSTAAKDDTKLTEGGFSDEAYTTITSDDSAPFTALATIISFEVEEI